MRSVLSKSLWITILGAGIVGIVTPARAQSVAEPKTVTVTPFLGVSFGTSGGRTSSLGIGGAVGYDLTSNLGFEAEIGYTFDVENDNDDLDWSLTNISGSVLYHFDMQRVTPYAVFGLGWERSNPESKVVPNGTPLEATTEIAWHFGGGVKVPVTDRFLARADLRRFQSNDLAPDHWRLYGGLTWWVKR